MSDQRYPETIDRGSGDLTETAPGLALPPRAAGLLLRATGLIGLPSSLLVAVITLLDLLRTPMRDDSGLIIGLIGLQLAGAGTALLRLRAAGWIAADSNLMRAALTCRLSLLQEAALLITASVTSAATGESTLVGGAILPAGLVVCFAYTWAYGKIVARARSLAAG